MKPKKLKRSTRRRVIGEPAALGITPAAPPTLDLRDIDPQKLYPRKTAAKLIGRREQTLAIWFTSNRYVLPTVRVGNRVYYRGSDLLDSLTNGLKKPELSAGK